MTTRYNIKYIYDVDSMSVDEFCEQLEKWAYSYKHWQDNYDSCLLLKAVEMIQYAKNYVNFENDSNCEEES